MEEKLMKKLKEKLMERTHFNSVLALLNWDEQVMMPKDGTVYRAKMMGYLAGLYHQKTLQLNEDGLLSKLEKKYENLSEEDKAIFKEALWNYERAKNVPLHLVEKISETTSEAHTVWMKAREANDFKLFQPILERIVDLKIEEANFIGYKKSPYDALLDDFERGVSSEQLTELFEKLKNFLVPFVQKVKTSKTQIQRLGGDFPINEQQQFDRLVAEKLGFNFEAGRLDSSTHPFTDGFNPGDVRITTRYDRNDLMQSVMSTIHETGHALYEQGLSKKNFGNPLGESLSFGFHESQSMMFEKRIGQSRPFWEYFYPKLKQYFPRALADFSSDDFYRAINTIEPSLIRTEADEATYCLHIILRFELERDLIEQKIRVSNLKDLWDMKMYDYLGIEVSDDTRGVLQDVHWSGGAFGYFPSYALGNLISAQILTTIKRELANFDHLLANGQFEEIVNWLTKNIYQYGKRYSSKELLKKVTGSDLDPQFFFDYLDNKYKEIYFK